MLRATCTFVLILTTVSCGGDGGNNSNRFSDYVPPENIFSAPVDDGRVVTSSLGGELVVDELILRMNPDTPAADVAAVVTQLGGTLVGQIPPMGIYQVRVVAETEAELLAAIDQAATLPGVLAAYENALVKKLSNAACFDKEDDNFAGWNRESRCALTDVQYFSLVPIMAEFTGYSPVRVTNLEYIELTTDQFDDAPQLEIGEFTAPANDSGHGTATGGIIAADQGDGSIGGVASSVLDDNLELVLTPRLSSTMDVYSHVYITAEYADVNVVNMSFAWSTLGDSPNPQRVVNEARETMRWAMQEFPDVLFVSAAGNEATEITEMNNAPGGIREPNHITVGGTAKCDPLSIWKDEGVADSGSNFGPLVDIAAPGERVPVIGYYPGLEYTDPQTHIRLNGTSLSAPLVTSAAAILWSIDPTLSPADVKDYIIDYAYGTDLSADGLLDTPRLLLAYPVQQLLLDIGAPGAEALFDPESTGETETTGQAVHRICGGSHLEISGVGSYDFPTDDNSALSLIDGGLGMSLVDGEGMMASLAGMGYTLALNSEMPWNDDGFMFTFNLLDEEEETVNRGGSTIAGSGGFTITECTVIERDGLTNMPMTVEVSGTLHGSFQATVPLTDPPTVWSFNGYFTLPMITLMASPALQDDIEHLCVGGIQHGD